MTASATGTATDLEDLVSDIITFLTTDADLVAASQEWTVLYQHRDGLAALTTDLTEQTSATYRKAVHGCRYEPRSLNVDSPLGYTGNVKCTGFTAGSSYIAFELRSTKEISDVVLRAPSESPSNMISNFKLQYSDTGLTGSWTTALTVSSNPSYTADEVKTFAVSGSPGTHVYWRILVDSNQQGSGTYLEWQSTLLLSSGGDVENHYGSEVIFQAPGNAGTDEIYTGLRSEYDSVNGWYNLFLNGFTGYDSDIVDFFDQPGALPGYSATNPMVVPMIPCWNSSIPYWFAADGRSFRIAVKVSTSFEGGYLGFITPYATPSQYPYPLAVGGSLIPDESQRDTEWRYSYNNYRHTVFTTPASESSAAVQADASLYLREPEGTWRSFGQRVSTTNPNTITPMTISNSYPYAFSGPAAVVWPTGVLDVASYTNGRLPCRDLIDGGYLLQPCVLVARLDEPVVYGELDGVKIISGYDNAAENTTTHDSVDYTIFQNVSRTEIHEFWALALP
jgi:hypothetical protein